MFVLYTAPLSDIILSHSINHQLFAADTQLQKSAPQQNDVQSLTRVFQLCTDDMRSWLCHNQLKSNKDKTETILFLTPSVFIWLLTIISHCWYSQLHFLTKLGTWGSSLTLMSQWNNIRVCLITYCELKCISSISSYLTVDATEKLVTSFVLPRLDYWNSLLIGTPNSVIKPKQKFQNSTACLILRALCHQHCTSLIQQLHWLPLSEHTATSLAPTLWTYSNFTGSHFQI